ncbi:hypothetical protein SC377_04815 [Actinotignum sp. SLA_B059]|uniref:hypothetical protein n=1 Tax=Actinotignum sp. SLA_B059 TaxID=3083287 RepID=UPI002A7FF594|nr:hypothetical protein [Actinotignum sp. SLA_B059]MDY5127467.1 hypothetical protein [Actinotignum sp. SLA_B059]
MIYPHEVKDGGYATSSGAVTVAGNPVRLELDPLDAAYAWKLEVSTDIYSMSARIAFQGQVKKLGFRSTFPVDPLLPLELSITGLPRGTSLDINLTAQGEKWEGPQRFTLLAYTPRLDFAAAFIGSLRIGGFIFPEERTLKPWLIIGQSRIGYCQLPAHDSYNAWRPILAPATGFTLERGASSNGFTSAATVGTLTVSICDALDPRASHLTRGTPVILQDRATRRRLFTGVLDRIVTTPRKDKTYSLELHCVDAVAELAARTKYQETYNNPPLWDNAVAKLLDGFNPHILAYEPYNLPRIGGMVREATLAAWLDVYCATVGASWHIDTGGRVNVAESPKGAPVAAIDMGEGTAPGLPAISPVEITAAMDTAATIATLTATNNGAVRGDDGEYQGTTETISATNYTTKVNYGDNTLNIETCAADAGALRRFLHAQLEQRPPAQTFTAATFTPWSGEYTRDNATLGVLFGLEIGQQVTARYRGEDTRLTITRITITADPGYIGYGLEFTNRKES